MRRTAKGSRAPLAPLHDNSLRSISPRRLDAKADAKQTAKPSHKAAPKANSTLQLPDKADAKLAKTTHLTGSKTARRSSPSKQRKKAQLITTSAAQPRSETLARIRQAVRKPAGTGKPSGQSGAAATTAQQPVAHAHAATAEVSVMASSLEHPTSLAVHTELTPASTTLRQWQLPVTPPSIRALLGPMETPPVAAASGRDVPTQHQAPSVSTVHGAGTPQDFTDVFDLDEVMFYA